MAKPGGAVGGVCAKGAQDAGPQRNDAPKLLQILRRYGFVLINLLDIRNLKIKPLLNSIYFAVV